MKPYVINHTINVFYPELKGIILNEVRITFVALFIIVIYNNNFVFSFLKYNLGYFLTNIFSSKRYRTPICPQ